MTRHICSTVSLRFDLPDSLVVCNKQFKRGKNKDTSGQCSKEICSLMSACIIGMKIERKRDRKREREKGEGSIKKRAPDGIRTIRYRMFCAH